MELRGTWDSSRGVFLASLALLSMFALCLSCCDPSLRTYRLDFARFFFDRKLPNPPFLTRSIGGTVGIPDFAQDSPIYCYLFFPIYLSRTVHAVAFGGLACMWGSGIVGRTHIGNTMVTVNEKMLMAAGLSSVK